MMTQVLRSLIQRRALANVVMMAFLVGGLYTAWTIRKEILPTWSERAVEVTIQLPGASPDEIETSILIPIEEAVRGIDGVRHVDGEAYEGLAMVTLSLLEGADPQRVLEDVKTSVDRMDTLPRDAENPVIVIPFETETVMSLIVYGDQPALWLHQAAESLRNDLRTRAGITRIELGFPRQQEVAVEVSQATLRSHGVTLADVAERIGESTLDLPAGTLYAETADIALRTTQRREWAEAFAPLVVADTAAGVPLRLGDIATIRDGFGVAPIECWFNGKPAIQLNVFAVGRETPLSVEKAVREYLDSPASKKFQGVRIAIFENQAEDYRSRMTLLIENALLGLGLVLVVLGLFMTPRLAFWVLVGIPTSLLGGLLMLPLFGATFNMLSMFAFIVTIGVVVDDAIMIAEAFHTHRSKGMDAISAVVEGIREIGVPVLLATSTTIVAFMPLFFVPGEMGVLFHQIPSVVVAVLIVSLLESLFILAAHLSHEGPERPWMRILARPQQIVNAKLEAFIRTVFRTYLQKSLRHPGTLLACTAAVILVTVGAIAGGLLAFSFTPTIASDTVIAQVTMPFGTPRLRTSEVQHRLVKAGQHVLTEHGMTSAGIFSCIGARLDEGEIEVETMAGSHYISVLLALPPKAERTMTGKQFAIAWREAFGSPAGLEAMSFTGETRVSGGEPIRLDVFNPDPSVARQAALSLGDRMRECAGLDSVDDGIRVGKPELRFALKDHGLHMGITADSMARQVRHRYHGAEALRFVRDGSEVWVMVRLPQEERTTRATLGDTLLQTPAGEFVPLSQVADITETHSFTVLARRDGHRIYPVTANVRMGISDDVVEEVLEEEILPAVMAEYPGTEIGEGGEEAEEDEALGALGMSYLCALGVMFVLLTVQFNSYRQPLLVLSVIPFSFVGAVWGHILLGHELSIVSVIGIIAMSGVVVNDSVLLVDAYNRLCARGVPHRRAIIEGACRRFRPVLLTSLTTFFGLVPLMLETSEQAQFLIPAAVSISFGLAVGTLITLTFVPVLLLFSMRATAVQAQSGCEDAPTRRMHL